MEKVCCVLPSYYPTSTWKGMCGAGLLIRTLSLQAVLWTFFTVGCLTASSVTLDSADVRSSYLGEISPTVAQSVVVTATSSLDISSLGVSAGEAETTEFVTRIGGEVSAIVPVVVSTSGSDVFGQVSEAVSLSYDGRHVPEVSKTAATVSDTPGEASALPFTSPVIGDSLRSSTSSKFVLATTDYVDSVAASLRWNPNEFVNEISPTSSFVELHSTSLQASTVNSSVVENEGLYATNQPETSENGSSILSPSSASAVSDFYVNRTTLISSESVSHVLVSIPSASATLASDMVEINTTIQSTLTSAIIPSTVHGNSATTALTTPVTTVTSHPPSPGNESCAQDNAGCVHYRGDESDDNHQMTIIVSVVCGVLAVLVCIGVVVCCMRNRRGKMSSGSKVDLSSYWDDSVTLSYINGHVDIPKDNADEMISLDNDSFLNSLDSMSFTNTWTSDSSKHTIF